MSLELLSTARDVLDLIPQLYDEDMSIWVRTLTEVRNAIYLQDGQLRSALRQAYGEDLTCVPWASFPTPDGENSGDGSLLEVTVSSDAITEAWTLTFTSATAYTIEGDISGSQGAGSTDTDSKSTNEYLVIPKDNWSGAPQSGDKIYIRVYDVESMLVDMSSKFAAAYLLDSIYTQEVPNASEAAEKWRAGAEKMLAECLDPRSRIELDVGYVGKDLTPRQILPRYIIDADGDDLTDYGVGTD